MINEVLAASSLLHEKGVNTEILKLNRLDRIDIDSIIDSAAKTGKVFVVEDCVQAGSVGEYIASQIIRRKTCATVELINFKDSFGEVGTVAENYKQNGMDSLGICKTVLSHIDN